MALTELRDKFGRFIKGQTSSSQTSSATDPTIINIRINNPIYSLFNAIYRSVTRGVTIKVPSVIAIALALAIFGRQSIDLNNLFIQKDGKSLDVNEYINKNVIVTGRLNPDKKTFSVFSITTVGP